MRGVGADPIGVGAGPGTGVGGMLLYTLGVYGLGGGGNCPFDVENDELDVDVPAIPVCGFMFPIPKNCWGCDWMIDPDCGVMLVDGVVLGVNGGIVRFPKEKMGGGAPLSDVVESSRLRGVGAAYWGVGAGPERGALGILYAEGSNGLGGGGGCCDGCCCCDGGCCCD